MVRTVYQQPSPEEVHAQLDRVIDQLENRFPKAASVLAEAGPDILAFTASRSHTGSRSGQTTRWNGSTRR